MIFLVLACVQTPIDDVEVSRAWLTHVNLAGAGIYTDHVWGDGTMHVIYAEDDREVIIPTNLSGSGYGVLLSAVSLPTDSVELEFDGVVTGDALFGEYVGGRVGAAFVAGVSRTDLTNDAGVHLLAEGDDWGLEIFAGLAFLDVEPTP